MKTMKVSQKGQTIVLFALGLLALLAMAALLVDGGQTYMHRRQAQAAADAGALAGARELCAGDREAAKTVAVDYAVTQNGASSAEAVLDPNNPALPATEVELVVTAHIAQKSFFAQLIGLNEVDVIARAASGCEPAGGLAALPVAWQCVPPLSDGTTPPTDNGSCVIQTVDYMTEIKPILIDPTRGVEHLKTHWLHDQYIVADKDKNLSCSPYGDLNCDPNGDGINELLGVQGGERGWLDLEGSGNSEGSIDEYICGIVDGNVRAHQWLPPKSGVSNDIYKKISDPKKTCDIQGTVVMLPVYNVFCDDFPISQECIDDAHTPPFPDGEDDFQWAVNKTDYHIVGLVPFYVSCVWSAKQDKCIGHLSAKDIYNELIYAKTDSSIEGYFLRNYPFNPGEGTPGGIDLGVYVRSLTQ